MAEVTAPRNQPADEAEHAEAVTVLHAIVASLVARWNGPLTLTAAQRKLETPGVLRTTLRSNGDIVAWIEPLEPGDDRKPGVIYVPE